MKKLTNYQLGPRGVNTKAGTVWIDPGQTVEIDAGDIIGDVPDLGKKPGAAASSDHADVKALTAQVAELTKQVEELEADKAELAKVGAAAAKEAEALKGQVAELTKQVETLTKPGK